MNKKEVALLIKKIEYYYPNRLKMDEPKILIGSWHDILKDSIYEQSDKKLMEYVKHNRFPPTISDLVAEPPKKNREQIQHENMLKEMYGDGIV